MVDTTKVLVEIKPFVLDSPKNVSVLLSEVLYGFIEIKGLIGVFTSEVTQLRLEELQANNYIRVMVS